MILVAGATGYLGGEICRRLTESGRPVRGLVRSTSDPNIVARLESLGVQVVRGDLRDRISLDAACAGVSAVISTATATRTRQPDESIESTDQDGQVNLVDAARAAGVPRFIYVSYSGQIEGDDPLTHAKRAVERQLRESGMTYTILRPNYFMEAWLSPALGFDYTSGHATIYGQGDRKISWISLADVAEFAVRALDAPGAENAVIELGGPEALSPNEVIRIFEESTGKRFDVEHVPEEALRAQRDGATDSLQRSFAALMLNYAKGSETPMDETLERWPVHLTSVKEYAARVR